MTEFQASLTASGDPEPIQTTVVLNGTNIELNAGGEPLGAWPIADLGLERILGGFRMTVEGESAVLRFDEPDPFADALAEAQGISVKEKDGPKRERKRKHKAPSVKKTTKAEKMIPPAQPPESPTPAVTGTVPERTGKPAGESGVGWLDVKLERAYKKFGRYMPNWLFTKGGLLVILAVLLFIIAKPGWFSSLFLLMAAIGLVAIAVAMLDQVIAVRIFRGGYTPIHGLIGSLAIGLVGILLGAI